MKIVLFFKSILHFFNLDAELENQDAVYEEIKKGIVFKGTNLWILIFAIIVASVGLNMNSTAVIIGAMLISPLMGPINGMGYSIATYDFVLFKKSLKNFSFAILASLVASTTYFFLSPISTAHSELLARTSPSIYDVLIALFGGLAGIVAISSKQKGNVIPGVAIATALMPPLCTAGYGLATGQFEFFFGAFYLFTINTIFIAIASVWISQILKFPIRTVIDTERKRKIQRSINIIILIVLLPSIYFGYKLVKQEKFLQNANNFITNVSYFENNYLLKHNIDAEKHKINLVYGGTELVEKQKKIIALKAADFDIDTEDISIEQGLTFGNMGDKNLELYNLKEQIRSLNTKLKHKNSKIDSLQSLSRFSQTLLSEIRTIYPQINGCSYAESLVYHDTLSTPQSTAIVVLSTQHNINIVDKAKITSWIKQRTQKEYIKLFLENDKAPK